MAGTRYTVSQMFKTKKEAEKFVADARKAGYGIGLTGGASITKIEKNSRFNPPYRYQVRRSDRPIKKIGRR